MCITFLRLRKKNWQQAHRIDERKKEAGYTKNVISQEEYEGILAKAKEKLARVEAKPKVISE